MQAYPEATSSLQGFAQGIGGIFDPEPRRSFESLGDLHSSGSRLGSLPHQVPTHTQKCVSCLGLKGAQGIFTSSTYALPLDLLLVWKDPCQAVGAAS